MGIRSALLAIAAAALLATPCFGARTALAQTTGGSIQVEGITFFSGNHFHFNNCETVGPAAGAFPNTVKRIYALTAYSEWQGNHKTRFKWYDPAGKLYDPGRPATFTGNGPTTNCDYLAVSRYQAEDRLGRWTMVLYVDGRVASTASFKLTGVGGPVSIGSVRFYTNAHFHRNTCSPAGSSSSTFSSSATGINAYIVYAVWRGTHRDRYQWFSPQGKLLMDQKNASYVGHGVEPTCAYKAIAGTWASKLTGQWKLRVLVDGRPRRTIRFTLVR